MTRRIVDLRSRSLLGACREARAAARSLPRNGGRRLAPHRLARTARVRGARSRAAHQREAPPHGRVRRARDKLEARAYELTSSAVGLDLVQRWRPSADTVFFNPGRYFVVVKWQQADRKALQDFVREMEKRLGSGSKKGRTSLYCFLGPAGIRKPMALVMGGFSTFWMS